MGEIIQKEGLAITDLLTRAVYFVSKDEVFSWAGAEETVDERCSLSKNLYSELNELAKFRGEYVNLIAGQLVFEYYLKSIHYANS